jgi:hypothetical protein
MLMQKLVLKRSNYVQNQRKKIQNDLSCISTEPSGPQKMIARLLVKKKTIRVLLDTGLSGDLLFMETLLNALLLQEGQFKSHGEFTKAPSRQPRWVALNSPLWSTILATWCICGQI